MSKTNGLIKRLTINIPSEEWKRIKSLKKQKGKKNYVDVILEAVNFLFEKEMGGVSA